MALSDGHMAALRLSILLYSGCHAGLPLPPPDDIQTSLDLVVWRNAPNISCDDITGYEIQFINSATNENVTESLNASATFYNLENLNETFKSGLTYVQVGNKVLLIIVPYLLVTLYSLEWFQEVNTLGSLAR